VNLQVGSSNLPGITIRTAHRGIVGDQPATFIVFYAGSKGMPHSQAAK